MSLGIVLVTVLDHHGAAVTNAGSGSTDSLGAHFILISVHQVHTITFIQESRL